MDSLGFVCQTAICLQVLLVNIVPCVVQCFSPHGFAMVCPCLSTNETYHGMFLLEKGSSIIGLWVSGYSIFKQKPSYVPLSDMPMDAYGRTPVAPATPCPLHPTRAAGRMVGKIRHFQSLRARLWHVMTNPKVLEGNLDILRYMGLGKYVEEWSFFGVPPFVPQNGWFIMDNAIDIDNLGPCLRNPHLGC